MLPDELIGPEGKQIRQSTMSGLDGLLYNATASRINGLEATSPNLSAPAVRKRVKGFIEESTPFVGFQLAANFNNATSNSAPSLMMGSNSSLFANPSPYKDEHQELSLLGKGGYGQVWKVRNHLDNQLYAVKKIVITSQRLQKFSKNAQVEALLAELRTLARLHHTNVVRYYHGWVEKTEPASNTSTAAKSRRNLLEAPSATSGLSESAMDDDAITATGMHGYSIQDSNLLSYSESAPDQRAIMDPPDDSGGIIFAEDSIPQELERIPAKRDRRGSRETNSSAHTFTKASMLSVGEEEGEDDDVETISRSLPKSLDRQLSVSHMHHARDQSPDHHVQPPYSGPDITLFIKMSLHPTTLSSFLSPDPPGEQDAVSLRHCFHQKPSIDMLSAILDGVEYLHSQGIVHRDLKPANIFLSVHKTRPPATSGFVDIKICPICADTSEGDHVYLTPCIGDFGLIAEMKDASSRNDEPQTTSESHGSPSSSLSQTIFEPSPLARLHNEDKPVGTQFYRPNKMPTREPRICPKLDVYSLGIVAFELLCRFGTRTERAIKLTNLGNGELPKDFEGHALADGILSMVKEDREQRWDCDMVRLWLQTSLERDSRS